MSSESPGRPGRPPVPEEDRRRTIGFRLRPDTIAQLRELAQLRNLSQAEVLAENIDAALLLELRTRELQTSKRARKKEPKKMVDHLKDLRERLKAVDKAAELVMSKGRYLTTWTSEDKVRKEIGDSLHELGLALLVLSGVVEEEMLRLQRVQ